MGGMQNGGSQSGNMGATQTAVMGVMANSAMQLGSMGGMQNSGIQTGIMDNMQTGMKQQTGSSVSITAGSSLVIQDSSGNRIYSATAVKSANSVVFCPDDLTSGESYNLYVNG